MAQSVRFYRAESALFEGPPDRPADSPDGELLSCFVADEHKLVPILLDVLRSHLGEVFPGTVKRMLSHRDDPVLLTLGLLDE